MLRLSKHPDEVAKVIWPGGLFLEFNLKLLELPEESTEETEATLVLCRIYQINRNDCKSFDDI